MNAVRKDGDPNNNYICPSLVTIMIIDMRLWNK
jgi:hypothetical protein